MNRRTFSFSALAALIGPPHAGFAEATVFEVTRIEAEWRAMLTEFEYTVMREEGTEDPWSSPLAVNEKAGTYACRGCNLAVYSSENKFFSETGWPSFWDVLPGAIGTKLDTSHNALRTECHCARCGGHLGHIFKDGPDPTGERHCLNGAAMLFQAA